MNQSKLILTDYIEPIGKVTRVQDNFEAMAERLGAQFQDLTPERLKNAVEYVLARWTRKTFPTYHMLQDGLRNAAVSNAQNFDAVSETEWLEQAVKFVATRKRSFAAVPFTEEFKAWRDYHVEHGHRKSAARFSTVSAQGYWHGDSWIAEKKIACPAQWPWDYDSSYESRIIVPDDPVDTRPTKDARERFRQMMQKRKEAA